MYDLQLLESPLSFLLPPIDKLFNIIKSWKLTWFIWQCYRTRISSIPSCYHNILGLGFWEYALVSKQKFKQKLKVTDSESQSAEKSIRKQRISKEWKKHRKNRLTSTSVHKIFIRKMNFDTLRKQVGKPFNEEIESKTCLRSWYK